MNNCALAHYCCNKDAEKIDRHLIQTCQTISRQDLFQESVALKVELSVWRSLLARFAMKDRNYFNVRFFVWAYFGLAQIKKKLFEVFFARTEFLALAICDSLVLVVGESRGRDKAR